MQWRPSTSLTVTLLVTLALVVTAIGLGLRLGPGDSARAVASAPSAMLAGAAAGARAVAGVEDVEPRVSVACPSVEARLRDVPLPAQNAVSEELAAMDRQVQDVNARLAGAPDRAASEADALAAARGAAIGRIVASIEDNNGTPPRGLRELAACALVGAELQASGSGPAPTGGPGAWSGDPSGVPAVTSGRVSCPSVDEALPAVPAEAQAEVSQNLDAMQREMADADARIAGLTGSEGGPEFIGNAILGPLTSRRVAAIDRIAIAIGRNAQRPTGLEVLAPCTLVS
jgi:hypothetical protein